MKWIVWALSLAFCCGCGRNLDEESVQLMEGMAALMEKEADCEKLTQALGQLALDKADLLKALKENEQKHPKTEEEKEKFSEKYAQRLLQAGVVIMEKSPRCQKTAGFMDVMKKFGD